MNNNFKLVQTLLYIRGEDGVSPKDLKDASDIPTVNARQLLKEFADEFNASEQGLKVVQFNDVFKFATREEFNDNISRLVSVEKKQKLSAAAIETVGIIAYKQPITKSQINDIRGVASEAVVNTLLVKGLIEEQGISPTPGNPILYGITNKFYDYFQIKSLKELPKLSEFNESEGLEDSLDLFQSQREEN